MRINDTMRLAWSFLFALAIIGAAVGFKGTSTAWLAETSLMGIAVALLVLQRPACERQR